MLDQVNHDRQRVKCAKLLMACNAKYVDVTACHGCIDPVES